jgi:hypothetical protein
MPRNICARGWETTMLKNDELELLLAELNEKELMEFGGPPEVEVLERYLRDEIPEGEEKEHVRATLVAHPELARAVVLWPEDNEISDAGIDQRWTAMRKQIGARGPDSVLPFRSVFPAIAAMLAIVFAGLFWHAQWRLARPAVAWNETLLSPDGSRGNGDTPVTLTPAGNSFFMVVPLIGHPPFDEYHLELMDGGRSLWRSSALQRSADDSFAILVPRSFLKAGSYQVVLYGEDGSHEEKLATYSVSVTSR